LGVDRRRRSTTFESEAKLSIRVGGHVCAVKVKVSEEMSFLNLWEKVTNPHGP
jgi:hypothetical protein